MILKPFTGKLLQFEEDSTREISLEGALSSAKTTAALVKMRKSLDAHPGIQWFLSRYSAADTETKLQPAFKAICESMDGDYPSWDAKELCFNFENGSKVWSYGLKAADARSKFSKLRGLGCAGILIDEAQELPPEIALELRARLRQPGYPHQLIFVSNPLPVDSWLAKQFPVNNAPIGRKLYQISLYDNQENLEPEMIASLEAAYPPEHPKFVSVILGKRGLNISGDPVYENVFQRKIHVRPVAYRSDALLLEAFEVGKHNMAWVIAQRHESGGVSYLGGLLGQGMILEDFLPIVQEHKAEWFPGVRADGIRSCTAPMGDKNTSKIERFTAMEILRKAGVRAQWRDNANAPDVRLAMIENIAGYMRRRSFDGQEALAVNDDPARWLRVSREGTEPCPFLDQGFEGGYVWSDHFVSVSNKEIKQPNPDDWFENGMHCAENIELNFCADRLTDAERAKRSRKSREASMESGPRQASGPESWMA